MPEEKTVMIIEDDRFLSSLIKTRLEKEGYKVSQAFDGGEAIEALKQANPKPNLIILDLIMPKSNGFEVLEYTSVDPELNKTPIIVLSNLAQESDVEKTRQLGATEFFVKVRISVDDIAKKVKSMIG